MPTKSKVYLCLAILEIDKTVGYMISCILHELKCIRITLRELANAILHADLFFKRNSCFTFCCDHTAIQKSCCCDNCVLFACLLRS